MTDDQLISVIRALWLTFAVVWIVGGIIFFYWIHPTKWKRRLRKLGKFTVYTLMVLGPFYIPLAVTAATFYFSP